MAQRSPVKRSSALAVVWFGIGAGLRPGELTALRGTDVGRAGATVVTRVAGPAPRTVPAAGRYGPLLEELARGAGDGFVFRPGPAARDYKNFVTGFAGRLVTDPAAPRLSMGRCRATFICDHLAAGTPPGELLAIDDGRLHRPGVTERLFRRLSPASRARLGIPGTARDQRNFLAAYRRVRYCFPLICSTADPSGLPKNRCLTPPELTAAARQ